jgi:hypothetical protein
MAPRFFQIWNLQDGLADADPTGVRQFIDALRNYRNQYMVPRCMALAGGIKGLASWKVGRAALKVTVPPISFDQG